MLKTGIHRFREQLKLCSTERKGRPSFIKKIVLAKISSFMQMCFQNCAGPATQLWLFSVNTNEDTINAVLIGWSRSQFIGGKMKSGFPCRGWLRCHKQAGHGAGSWDFSLRFFPGHGEHEEPLSGNDQVAFITFKMWALVWPKRVYIRG